MILPPLIPSPLSFQSILLDPTNSHNLDLSKSNVSRAKLRTTLKATRKVSNNLNNGNSDNNIIDWVAAEQAAADYLPYLFSIVRCLEIDELLLKGHPVFTWKSTLSSSLLKKSEVKINLPSVHYELSATLLSYGICLMNRAATLVASLGSYETSASVSSAALDVHSETINSAAQILCRASGVLHYLAEVQIPIWEVAVGDSIKSRPVELTRSVVSALSSIALADANLLAIRRLLSRSVAVAHSSITPGPPLSSTHPSPSLLAKLHLNVYQLYDEARSLCKNSSRSDDSQGELSPELLRYLTDGRSIALGLSYKWLGIDAGENGGREKSGEAVGWLELSKKELKIILGKTEGLKSFKIGKGKLTGQAGKSAVERELASIATFLDAYKKINDSLHYQPIPPTTILQAKVPLGRAALNVKPFKIPAALPFTSRRRPLDSPSSNYLQSPTTTPELCATIDSAVNLEDDSSDEEDGGIGNTKGGIGETTGGGSYFGSGSYF